MHAIERPRIVCALQPHLITCCAHFLQLRIRACDRMARAWRVRVRGAPSCQGGQANLSRNGVPSSIGAVICPSERVFLNLLEGHCNMTSDHSLLVAIRCKLIRDYGLQIDTPLIYTPSFMGTMVPVRVPESVCEKYRRFDFDHRLDRLDMSNNIERCRRWRSGVV